MSCNSKENPIPEKKEIPTSRILSEDLMNQLLELIKIYNEKIDLYGTPTFHFLVSKNYVYVSLINSNPDCPRMIPYYEYWEKINNVEYLFELNGRSMNLERFFDVKDLELKESPEMPTMLCHPDGISVRYIIENSKKLTLEKIIEFREGGLDENMLSDEDTAFIMEIVEESLPSQPTE